ncbi:MAG: TonB-dependent receptor [Bacteroidetes bacterium]|nr:TonB-dependent receptor [Fibrella sp.]
MAQITRYLLTAGLFTLSLSVFAQQPTRPAKPVREGEIDNQEITVEKSRKIELPPANRILNKIPSVKTTEQPRKLTYDFQDRRLTVGDPRIPLTPLAVGGTQSDAQPVFNNYAKVGAGNFGTFLGEAFVGIHDQPNYGVEVSAKHISSGIGPVDGKNSAQSDTRLHISGKYLTDQFKLTGLVGYDREQYYFYGYRPTAEPVNRDLIRQRLNTLRLTLGIENVNTESAVDYSLKTGITTLNDFYVASETDWGTNFTSSLGVTDNVVALLQADAYVTQRTDGPVDNRNLFRVKPSFKYTSPALTITAGINAVNETDRRLGINNTRAFPVVDIDVVPVRNVHFFAGVDGDIVRNTLRSFLNENRWLAPQLVLANTTKSADFYAGSKGELGSGFSYEGKVSYARYRNFYGFNNSFSLSGADTAKFFVLYDSGGTNVTTITGQLGYTLKDRFRSNLKVDVYNYALDRLEEAWGRPRIAGSWSNAYTLNKKLFVTADLYFYEGIKNKNFVSDVVTTLKPIVDANLKIDYFLGQQISAFVALNNIVGRNYERYLYYKVQGLNFQGGISYSF